MEESAQSFSAPQRSWPAASGIMSTSSARPYLVIRPARCVPQAHVAPRAKLLPHVAGVPELARRLLFAATPDHRVSSVLL